MSHDQPNPLEADTERIRLVLGLLEKNTEPLPGPNSTAALAKTPTPPSEASTNSTTTKS